MMDVKRETPSPQSSDETCSVADALGRAKAELENVQAYCENVRQQAAERLKTLRAASVGDVIDGTLDAVRRHPGASLTIAALVGFFLGGLFRRR
jgi:ElaB/YqjD/DUF883 family membrane-anchored ribosome-binding protein